MMDDMKDICPCCYSRTLTGRRHFEICEVCFWEDDGQDDVDADFVRGGPNGNLSLTEGRANYSALRSSDRLHSPSVRRPRPEELTAKSMRSTIALTVGDQPARYTLRKVLDGSPIDTIDILCPPDADESWRKRVAVLAAHAARRGGAGDLLNHADLTRAYLRDINLGGKLGDLDLSHASLDEADLVLAVLHGVRMIGTKLRRANMRSMLMCDAVLHSATLNGADLTGSRLIGTQFIHGFLREANLSRVNANKADFYNCDLSGADLSYGSFEGACFDRAILTGANITGAWFCGATFKGAVFRGLDLSSANFSGAIIEGAIVNAEDLVSIPIIPDIHKAIYAAASVPGTLDMRSWHACQTTHCRAGWVVTLAGSAGAALEDKLGTEPAATLIYLASDPHIKSIPDFHASDEDAMADMQRLALGEDVGE
jgi:uncharacterized protein YjbI with pentapeptide repeats